MKLTLTFSTMTFLLFVLFFGLAQSCHLELEETICENMKFSSDLILNSSTNKLTLKNCSGDLIHENFLQLDQVSELRLVDCELNKIEAGSLCCTPNLTSIIAIRTQLPKIDRKVLRGCEKLKKLNLDGVEIRLDGALNLPNLQVLSLNGTTLRELKDGFFAGLPTLKSLTIQNSPLRRIPEDAFRGIEDVKVVDLQGNGIEVIEKRAFRNLTQLKVLNLSDNRIKGLTWNEFDGLEGLRVLFLERNEFDTVDVEKLVQGVPELERVFLSYDKLKPENRKLIEEVLPKNNITFIYIGKPYTV